MTMFRNAYDQAVKLGTEAHAGKTWAGGMPYTEHLKAVEVNVRRFCRLSLLGKAAIMEMLCAAAWLHDSVEDTWVSLERIEQDCGPEVRTLVWAVTDEPGANRKERHDRTYPKIKNVAFAVALKLADRIANVEAACTHSSSSSYLNMYRQEHEEFKRALYTSGQFEEMWSHLDKLLAPEPSKAALKVADQLVAYLRETIDGDGIKLSEIHKRFASIVQVNLK